MTRYSERRLGDAPTLPIFHRPRTLSVITDSKIPEIQAVLTEVDEILRKRLASLGVYVAHVVLAIAPDGAGVVRSNVGPAELGDMAELLAAIADGSALERTQEEPLH